MAQNNSAFIWCSNYVFQFFFCFGIFLPFYQLWLSHLGMGSEAIGTILAVGLVSRCFASLGSAMLVKHESQYQNALRGISLLGLITAVSMLFTGPSFLVLLLITVLFNAAIAPGFGISDAIIATLDKRNLLSYGPTRMWGSLGFVGATFIGGYCFDIWSIAALPIILMVSCSLLLMSVAIECPEIKHDKVLDKKALNIKQEPWVTNDLIMLLVILSLLQGSHGFFYGFSSVYWQEIGIPEATIGSLWGISIVSEILVFIFAKRALGNFTPKLLLQLAAVGVILRWSGLALAEQAGWIALSQLLHGVTFAMTHLAAIRAIQLYLPESQMAKFQGLYNGLYMGVTALVTFVTGFYYDTLKADLFFTMALMGGLGVVLTLTLNLKPRESLSAQV